MASSIEAIRSGPLAAGGCRSAFGRSALLGELVGMEKLIARTSCRSEVTLVQTGDPSVRAKLHLLTADARKHMSYLVLRQIYFSQHGMIAL